MPLPLLISSTVVCGESRGVYVVIKAFMQPPSHGQANVLFRATVKLFPRRTQTSHNSNGGFLSGLSARLFGAALGIIEPHAPVIFLFYELKRCILQCCFKLFSLCSPVSPLLYRSLVHLQTHSSPCSFSLLTSVIRSRLRCAPTFSNTTSMFKRFDRKPMSGVRTRSYFKDFIFQFISFHFLVTTTCGLQGWPEPIPPVTRLGEKLVTDVVTSPAQGPHATQHSVPHTHLTHSHTVLSQSNGSYHVFTRCAAPPSSGPN